MKTANDVLTNFGHCQVPCANEKLTRLDQRAVQTGLNKRILPYSVLLLTAVLSIFKLFSL